MRFLQNDPIIGNRPTEHYAYAGNDPVSFRDPTGRDITPQQLATYNDAYARTKAAYAARDGEALNTAALDFERIATEILSAQRWWEYWDSATAREMFRVFMATPKSISSHPPSLEQIQESLQLGSQAGEALRSQTKVLERTEIGLEVLDKAGTAASFMLGGGALLTAAKEGGLKLVATQTAKGIAYMAATDLAIDVGVDIAVDQGVLGKEYAEDAKAGGRAIVSLVNLGRLARADGKLRSTAKRIARGHAWDKHVIEGGEFPGVSSQKEFEKLIYGVMRSPTAYKPGLNRGRAAWWSRGTVVIYDPNHVDLGTAFKSKRSYFDTLK